MLPKITFVLLIVASTCVQAQDIFFYHGRKNESTVYDYARSTSVAPIRKKPGEVIEVRLLNPNPLFYKYEIVFEEQKDEVEDASATAAFTTLNTLLRSRADAGLADDAKFEAYKEAIKQLNKDINEANRLILGSDLPEGPADAFNLVRTRGLRYVIDELGRSGTATLLPSSTARFHSPTLLADLNGLLAAVPSGIIDAVLKEALGVLNASLADKVTQLKTSLIQAESRSPVTRFVVKDKKAKIYLIIKPIDPTKAPSLMRDFHTGEEKIELASVEPLYDRARFELVPVGNVVFLNDASTFSIENNVVAESKRDRAIISPGVVAQYTAWSFGERKEMSIGIGLGYKFSTKGDVLENFYASTMFSYKNFLRVGVGLGSAQTPYRLKDNAMVGQPLPSNISSLNDLIQYDSKFAPFLTFSFTGLDLVKK